MNEQHRFARIVEVELTDFSLYTLNPNARVSFIDGVSCLVGANGIGKSTFIAAINFALTGRVADPSRKFESVDEYYEHSRAFSATYFRGRVDVADIRTAEVAVTVDIGDTRIRVARGLMETDTLRSLSINRGEVNSSRDDELLTMSPSDLQDAYAQEVARLTGLKTFEQFVFLQLFLFTFDERRHLLFWDEAVLERVLFLAFGLSPEDADRADTLRRQEQAHDSNVRNAQWQATRAQKALDEVLNKERSTEASVPADLRAEIEALLDREAELESTVEERQTAVDDAELLVETIAAEQASIEADFARIFAERANRAIPPIASSLIESVFTNSACPVCNSALDGRVQDIQELIDRSICPLCRSAVHVDDNDPLLPQLRTLDARRTELRRRSSGAFDSLRIARDQQETAESELRAVRETIVGLDEQHGIVRRREPADRFDALVESYKREIADARARRQTHYDERERVKRELRVLQRNLHERYITVEEQFVPSFEQLARQFLGLDLSVVMEQRADSTRIGLVIAVRNELRRDSSSLSESQRFFIDIALRMAFTQHFNSSAAGSVMLVDTPEGSLDLAYEGRAGEMFGTFVRNGHQLIMTANINTSKLLLRLANICGSARMQIVRMTDWAELSDVQLEAEAQFEEAYDAIAGALAGARA